MERKKKGLKKVGKIMASNNNLKELKKKASLLSEAAEIISVQEKDLPRVVKRFQNEIEEMDKKLKS
jgi:alanyl-tRNA synthetase